VRNRNRLQAQVQAIDMFNNCLRVIAGIDTDCLPRFFTSNNAGVLLKSRNRYLLD
jgi:hypothetical protein